MAMQVEVGSALPSLTNRSELPNEAQLQHAFASALSDASNKPSELPGPLSPLILEERNKFGNPLRPASMPPVASRPRLTAKPFCREKSSDTFAMVKPPVPALKPSIVAPNPPPFAKTFEDMTVTKGITGNVPPLVDQKLIENKTTGELVANMPFDSSPQANTVILFETGRSVKSRMKFTPEKSHLSSPQICSTSPAPEGHLHPAGSETFCRAASVHRQLSLSSEARPLSWNPCVSLERKGSCSGASEEKGRVIERQHSTGPSLAYEGQPRPKQRPVSAIFLESLKDQKHCSPEVSEEKSLPEKSWTRKPRPLSMDLTAKFENKDLSLLRKSCPTESKEKNLSTDPTNQGSVRTSERWAKSEATALNKADPSKPNLKSPGPFADFTSVLNQKPFPNEVASPCQGMQKETPVSARDRKCLWELWELRLKRQDEQNASETEAGTTPEKGTEPSSVKGQSIKDSAVLSQNEPCAARKDCANILDPEKQSLRDIEKPVNMLDKSANESTSGTVGSQQESPGNENRIINIQQRIKELTAENPETKPGNQRRSLRSRPLSADLTKLFTSPAIPSELKSEKPAELNRKPATEAQETGEMKINLLRGADSGEAHTGGVPWRSQQPTRTPPLRRNGSFARERPTVALQGESPASVADHDMHTSSAPLAEKAGIKTVRATMFEHHVQRHKVAADHLGGELPSQLMNELGGTGRESKVGQVAGAKTFSKEVLCRQLDTSADAEQPGKANSFSGDGVLQDTVWKKSSAVESCEDPTAKCVEDSLVYQRIEPRYEILQTVGKRAQSEAVALVCEDKAVTLRSRRSLKERRKPGEGFVDASWSRSLDVRGDGRKVEGSISRTKEAGETTARTGASNVSCGQSAFCEQVTDLDKNQIGQKHVTVKAAYFINRKTAADESVSMMSSELEKEKSKEKTEGSKMPKLLPENFGARPGRVEDGGADGSQNTVSGTPKELRTGSKLSHHGADMRNHEWEEPRILGVRKYPAAHGAQRTLDAAGHRPEGDPAQHLDAEEQVKRSSRRGPGGKASDRWRRKTLPHDIRFEEAGSLAEEGVKMLIRRDSLQFHEGSLAKKSKKPRCVVEPKEGTLVSPSSPEDLFKDQQSSLKPKATYFAVTCQIPNEAEGSSVKEFAHKSKQISSLVENTSSAFSAGTARKPYPLPDHQFCTAVSDTQGSLDKRFGKNWEEAGEEDASGLLKKGVCKYPGSEGRDENWRSLKRQVDDAKERIPGVESSLHASSPCELKSPSYLRHLHHDDEHLGHKKHSDSSCGAPKEKTTDNYRSRVLDIDALMAEYKEDSLKPLAIQDWREGENSSLFPWEKYKRSSSDKISLNFNRKDPQTRKDSSGGPRQDISSTEVRGPENVCVGERERLKSCSQEPSSFKNRDGKFSPPPWGRPSAACLPPDAVSTKKKTFILDEEPEECQGLLRTQSVKYGECRMQVHIPVSLDLKAEASFAPHPSSLWKGASSNQQQATDVPLERDWHSASSRSKRKSSGSPHKSSSSTIQSQAGWDTSAFANASPGLTCSYSEKNHQARVKGSLPGGPEARERQDQHQVHPSKDNRQSRRSASQQRSLFREDKKDVEKERSRQDPESPGASSSPRLALQRRSRSFYRDRRVDRWAEDQLKQCCGRPAAEAKDTDSLVREADSHYGTWSEPRHSGDSLVADSPSSESNVTSARKQPPGSRLSSFSSQTDPASTMDPHDSSRDLRSGSLDRSSTDVDSADGTEGLAAAAVAEASPDFSFLEQTSVLDSSVLKTRVQLSKRRRQHRAPISHVLRRSGGREAERQLSTAEEAGGTWTFKDSLEKSAKPEDSEEEGTGHPPSDRLPLSQSQRLPIFPGLDHSALKAQLRRRQEPEGTEELGPVPLSRSPKPAFQTGGSGVRVLPAGTEKEERLEEASPSPQWLKELKSKKRQSQYENQV